MSKSTTCNKALQIWESNHPGENPTEAEIVKLNFQIPPIEKMDPPILNTLVNCKFLSLSTNAIDKMINLPNLRNLEILSLARNNIKKIAGLEEIGQTLKELWLSYNQIERLDNLQSCSKLKTLYITCNKISNWDEVDKLKDLSELANLSLYNNKIYDNNPQEQNKIWVLKKLGNLKNIEGQIVDDPMMEKVKACETEPPIFEKKKG